MCPECGSPTKKQGISDGHNGTTYKWCTKCSWDEEK